MPGVEGKSTSDERSLKNLHLHAIDFGASMGEFYKPPHAGLINIVRLGREQNDLVTDVEGAVLGMAGMAAGYGKITFPENSDFQSNYHSSLLEKERIWQLGSRVGQALANLDPNTARQCIRVDTIGRPAEGTPFAGALLVISEAIAVASNAIHIRAPEACDELLGEEYDNLRIATQTLLLPGPHGIYQLVSFMQKRNSQNMTWEGDEESLIDEDQEFIKVDMLVKKELQELEKLDLVTQDNHRLRTIEHRPIVHGQWGLTPEGRKQLAAFFREKVKA